MPFAYDYDRIEPRRRIGSGHGRREKDRRSRSRIWTTGGGVSLDLLAETSAAVRAKSDEQGNPLLVRLPKAL